MGLHASKALLVHIHKVGFDPMTGGLRTNNNEEVQKNLNSGHSWADKIGALVKTEYDKRFEGSTYHKRKVLAGIVVDISGTSSVICLSTGTKCINGELISLDGLSLNDCHAEVIVRRCLVYWLYSQLEHVLQYGDKGPDGVLEHDMDGGFKIKSGVSFHLFVSTAPCGDARIFSLHEQPSGDSNVLSGYAGRMGEGNRGKLRSKIESGMGTVPLPEQERVQTWDGVLSGERLLTMACSDKILSWNVIGLQGSLLSHWLKPVYFSSITIGSKFHPDHVTRALHGRINTHNLSLPRNYRLNQPPLLATTSPEARQPSKAQEHSVNWVRGFAPEIVCCSTGKTNQGAPSRLCKRSFADNFLRICSLPSSLMFSRTSLNLRTLADIQMSSYDRLKSLASDNMAAKRELIKTLTESGCGRWVVKPIEQDQFPMSVNRMIPQLSSNGSMSHLNDSNGRQHHLAASFDWQIGSNERVSYLAAPKEGKNEANNWTNGRMTPHWRGPTIVTNIVHLLKHKTLLLLWNLTKLYFIINSRTASIVIIEIFLLLSKNVCNFVIFIFERTFFPVSLGLPGGCHDQVL